MLPGIKKHHNFIIFAHISDICMRLRTIGKIATLFLFLLISSRGHAQLYATDPLLMAGYLQMYAGNSENATRKYVEALNMAVKNGNRLIEGEAYRLLGETSRAMGNYPDALEYLYKSEVIFSDLNNQYGLASVKNRKAAVFLEKKQFALALSYASNAEKTCRKEGYDDLLYNILVVKAACYHQDKKEYPYSLALLHEASAIASRLNAEIDYPYIYINLANVHLQMEQLDSARIYARKSFDLGMKYNAKSYLIHSLRFLSKVCAQQKDFEEAYRYETLREAYRDSMITERKNKEISTVLDKFKSEQQVEIIKKQQKEITLILSLLGLGVLVILITVKAYKQKEKSGKELENKNRYIKEQNLQLEVINKNKDKLLAMLSHDLRSPMASLAGIIHLYDTDNLTVNEFKEISRRLSLQVEQNSVMLDNLLFWIKNQFTGKNPGSASTYVKQVADDVVKFYEPQIVLKDIRVVQDIPAEVKVLADEEFVRLVYRNLLSNALKFSNKSGRIELSVITKENQIIFTVTDNGVGMSAEKAGTLFRWHKGISYGTSKETGMGMGLSLVKEFIEKTGGEIWVESEEHKGTTFFFSLPPAA